MKVFLLICSLILIAIFMPILHAFEETLPDHSHRICLGNGEGSNQDAEIYIGCVQPGMPIDPDNWVNNKIPSLGRSWQMVSTVTDGTGWYMANTSVADQHIYIGVYNNKADPNAPNSSNWSNTNLKNQMGRSHGGVGLAYDQNRWCISNTTGSSPYKIYIGCTENLENVGHAGSWKNVDISSTLGKSRQAVDLATDGINWAITGTEQHSDKIHVGVMVNPLNDLLNASNWKDVNIGPQLGNSSTPMDIATDGKRWCIANTTGNGDHEIYIGCTKEQGMDPSVASNWQNVNIKAIMGKSHTGLSLATDGIVWCMGNTGGGSAEIYLGCTRPGTDPLNPGSWYNHNLKGKMGHSAQGVDVAFYRSCYYPGEKPSSQSKNLPLHGCCESLTYNSETERCELPDFPPDVKDWLVEQGSGCQTTFADSTQITFYEVIRRMRIFHLMFASEKPVGVATMSSEQQDKYFNDMIEFIELPKDYKNIMYGQSKGGAPIEMGDALIEVASFQKETMKNAYAAYESRLKIITKAQQLLIDFMKKPVEKLTDADRKVFSQNICEKLFDNETSTTQGKSGKDAQKYCIETYSTAPQTLALVLDEQSLNNQNAFYSKMEAVFTKTQILFENVTRLAKNETWNCSHSTTMQCGSKRIFDVDEKVFYVNPLFPNHHLAYKKLNIPTTTIFGGVSSGYRGTKPVAGSRIKDLKSWYESKEFFQSEDENYRRIIATMSGIKVDVTSDDSGTHGNNVGLPGISENHQEFMNSLVGEEEGSKLAFEFFLMLTQYRIMTQEEVATQKLPVSELIPALYNQKVFFRKDLMAYVIDLEMMNNFLASYFKTGALYASNQSSCVGNVINTATSSAFSGGAAFTNSKSIEIGNSTGTGPQGGGTGASGQNVGNETLVGINGINNFALQNNGSGTFSAYDSGINSHGGSGGNLSNSENSSLNAHRQHMKKRQDKFLKFKSTKDGERFVKNVKAGLASYKQRLSHALKNGHATHAAQSALASTNITAPQESGKDTHNGHGQHELNANLEDQNSGGHADYRNQGGSYFGGGQAGAASSNNLVSNSNLSGLSEEDQNRILNNLHKSQYDRDEEDSLFTIITKRYMITGLPRLLNRKKSGD
ncbi:MAG: hypothetical protein HYV97_15320 [Bdellovibrio sp.]|nr:hypothetical protein [Bdellovibrio sp.]